MEHGRDTSLETIVTAAFPPSTLGLHHDPDEWRELQFEALCAAKDAFDSGKKYVLLEAPPGVGKTDIAIGLARLIGGGRGMFLTATKDLQDQYAGYGPAKVIGRGNFICTIDPSHNADRGICTEGEKCEYAGLRGMDGCGYYNQLRTAVAMPEIVSNYAYFLPTANYSQGEHAKRFTSLSLLVCDEAHLLRHQLESFASSTSPRRYLQQIGLDLHEGPASTDLRDEDWLDWARDVKQAVMTTAVERPRPDESESDARYRVRKTYAAAKCLLDAADQEGDLPLMLVNKFTIEARPIWVTHLGMPMVAKHSSRVLFLSATIGDPSLFMASLGLPTDSNSVAYIPVPSTFEKSRRPINYWPVMKVAGGAHTDKSAAELIPHIERIIDHHAGQNGIIHTVSYTMAKAIRDRLDSRFSDRVRIHEGGVSRAQAIADFRRDGGVILSPSMTTGIDLPYDGCRWQILVKIPFADKSDPVLKRQLEVDLGKKLYTADTAVTMAQAYGRIMRAADDWGTTYLLDSNYQWFKGAAGRALPEWFREAVRE